MTDKKDSTASRSLRAFRLLTILFSFFGGLYMATAIVVWLMPPGQPIATLQTRGYSLLYVAAWITYGAYCFYGLLDFYYTFDEIETPPLPKRYSLPWSLTKTVVDGILIAISMNILSNAAAAEYPWTTSTLGLTWSPATVMGWLGFVSIIARGFSLMLFEGWPFYEDIDEDTPVGEVVDDT